MIFLVWSMYESLRGPCRTCPFHSSLARRASSQSNSSTSDWLVPHPKLLVTGPLLPGGHHHGLSKMPQTWLLSVATTWLTVNSLIFATKRWKRRLPPISLLLSLFRSPLQMVTGTDEPVCCLGRYLTRASIQVQPQAEPFSCSLTLTCLGDRNALLFSLGKGENHLSFIPDSFPEDKESIDSHPFLSPVLCPPDWRMGDSHLWVGQFCRYFVSPRRVVWSTAGRCCQNTGTLWFHKRCSLLLVPSLGKSAQYLRHRCICANCISLSTSSCEGQKTWPQIDLPARRYIVLLNFRLYWFLVQMVFLGLQLPRVFSGWEVVGGGVLGLLWKLTRGLTHQTPAEDSPLSQLLKQKSWNVT